jgi:hypothetical protein
LDRLRVVVRPEPVQGLLDLDLDLDLEVGWQRRQINRLKGVKLSILRRLISIVKRHNISVKLIELRLQLKLYYSS